MIMLGIGDARGTVPMGGVEMGGVENMAMPRRDKSVKSIKRRAAEKPAAEKKKKADARSRAAYRRRQRKFV